LESGEPGYNKVFITGRVERDEGRKKVAVHIEDGMPTHASDPAHLPISTKGSVRVGSGSSFERDKPILLQRTEMAGQTVDQN